MGYLLENGWFVCVAPAAPCVQLLSLRRRCVNGLDRVFPDHSAKLLQHLLDVRVGLNRGFGLPLALGPQP